MDINLTGQLWGMPVKLIGQATQDIKITDWSPLLAVFLTAVFTYFITATIQEWNHRKELKRQVYFELIDVITKVKKVYEDNRLSPVSVDPEMDKERKDREMVIATAFQAAKFKAYIGGSKEFNKLIDINLPPEVLKTCDLVTYKKIVKILIDQMTKELITPTAAEKIKKRLDLRHAANLPTGQEEVKKKCCWQFWK